MLKTEIKESRLIFYGTDSNLGEIYNNKRKKVIYSFELGSGEGGEAEKDSNTGQEAADFIRDLGKFSFVQNSRRKQFSVPPSPLLANYHHT
ncbi:hypothetical protein CEXT_11001 [Caerostris extrusa]|uniref:Uncharacterized protein n=1 Tax=Caerostris extrusa TaxID=172846 RepID=A0AAV4MCF1_CAEEX|nr:hypothetical protein CEXT_11001 [Caerostris extrusa]